MAIPDKDLTIIDCELADFELDGTVPAVIAVVITVVPAEVLKIVVLAEVESGFRVEVDEGTCDIWSASTNSTRQIMIPTYRLQRHRLQHVSVHIGRSTTRVGRK